MTEPLIRLDGVHKWFGDLHVLKGIDLRVEAQEVVVVIGPSGSGKSTLLRCINLLEEPTSGRVWFEDVELTDVRTTSTGSGPTWGSCSRRTTCSPTRRRQTISPWPSER